MIHSSHRFDAPIWKVLPDHANFNLAIELRDREHQSLKIAYLNLAGNRSPLFLTEEIDWWKGLQTVFQGKILLHGYEDPGLPLQRGIYVYEGQKGRKLWGSDSLKFTSYTENGIIAESKMELKLYDWKSGKEVMPASPQEIWDQMEKSQAANLSFPQAFVDAHESFEELAEIIREKSGKAAEVQIDSIGFREYQIYNFYNRNPDKSWSQFLGIKKDENWVFYRQTAKALKGLGLDPFFIFKNYLIWIEQQNTLAYLLLDESTGST